MKYLCIPFSFSSNVYLHLSYFGTYAAFCIFKHKDCFEIIYLSSHISLYEIFWRWVCYVCQSTWNLNFFYLFNTDEMSLYFHIYNLKSLCFQNYSAVCSRFFLTLKSQNGLWWLKINLKNSLSTQVNVNVLGKVCQICLNTYVYPCM